MDFDEVERLVEQGERVGFAMPTSDPAYLGWILLAKVKPNLRLLELVDFTEAPLQVAEERRRQIAPYMLLRLELARSVHEAGNYETEEDYRLKERFWFSTLDEVEAKLAEWGYSLIHAKGSRELDAP